MASLGETINTADLPESQGGFDPLPPGWYQAMISEAEACVTRAGTGRYIKVQYEIMGPSHIGRKVFGNLNLKNPNPKAEEIGRAQLGSLLRAAGLSQIIDTDQLIGANLQIKLSVRPSDGQYDASNDVKDYKSLDGAQPVMPAVAKPETAPWGARR